MIIKKTTAIAISLCLLLNACGIRPGNTYRTSTTTSPPPTFQVSPQGQQPQASDSAKPADASPAAAATPAPPPPTQDENAETTGGRGMSSYVGPAILIVGTAVAAGLFFWGNTHWFKDQ